MPEHLPQFLRWARGPGSLLHAPRGPAGVLEREAAYRGDQAPWIAPCLARVHPGDQVIKAVQPGAEATEAVERADDQYRGACPRGILGEPGRPRLEFRGVIMKKRGVPETR